MISQIAVAGTFVSQGTRARASSATRAKPPTVHVTSGFRWRTASAARRARKERHGAEEVLDRRQESELARARSIGERVQDNEADVEVVADRGEEAVEPRPPNPRKSPRRQPLVVLRRLRRCAVGIFERLPVEPVGPEMIEPADPTLRADASGTARAASREA